MLNFYFFFLNSLIVIFFILNNLYLLLLILLIKGVFIINLESDEPIIIINPEGSKAMVAAWGYLNKYIITGHENGAISQYDWKVGSE